MAYQPQQFPILDFEQANPYLTGFMKGQGIQKQGMENYFYPLQQQQELENALYKNAIAKVGAQYAQPMAQESLTSAQQQNLWNPKIWQSEIGLRGAQSGLAGAQAGRLNALTPLEKALKEVELKYAPSLAEQNLKKAELENTWYPQVQQSEIGLRGAQSQQLNAAAKKIEKMLPFDISEAEFNQIKRGLTFPYELSALQSEQAKRDIINKQIQKYLQDANQVSPVPQNVMPVAEQHIPNGMGSEVQQQPTGAPQQENIAQVGSPQMPLPVAMMMSKEFGFTPHVTEANGQKMIVTPFGNYPIGQTSKTQEYAEKLETKGWDKTLTEANKGAESANAIKTHIDSMNYLYDQLPFFEKGPIPGTGNRTFAVSGTSQEFDKHAAGVYTDMARAVQSQHITNANFDTFKQMKLNRSMSPESFLRFKNFSEGAAQRANQKAEFLDLAHDAGMTKNKAEQAWIKYINDNNFYNANDGTLNAENLDNSKFGKYIKIPGKEEGKKSEKSSNNITVKWKRVNGKLVRE